MSKKIKTKVFFRLEGIVETEKNLLDLTIKELGKLINKKPQIVFSKRVEKETNI